MKPLLTSSEAEQVQYFLCAQIQTSRFPDLKNFCLKKYFGPKIEILSSFNSPLNIWHFKPLWVCFFCGKQKKEAFSKTILVNLFHAVTINKSFLNHRSKSIWNFYYGLNVLVWIYMYNYFYFYVNRNGEEGRSAQPGSKTVGYKVCRFKRSFKLNCLLYNTKTKLNWWVYMIVV